MIQDLKTTNPSWYDTLVNADHQDVLAYHDLAVSAMSGNPVAKQAIQATFGCDGTVKDTYLILSACTDLMTDAEIDRSALESERNLNYISAFGAPAPDVAGRIYAKMATPLRILRLKKNLTQKALADVSGINIRQIQRLENGESDINNVTLKNAIALASALGVDVKELMN